MTVVSVLNIGKDVVSGPLDGNFANLTKMSYMNKTISWIINNATSFGDSYDSVATTVGEMRDKLCELVTLINEMSGDLPELFMLDNDLTSYVSISNDSSYKESISLDEFD